MPRCGIPNHQPRRPARLRPYLRRLSVRLAGHVSTFSVAGQRLGFADERGTLFHEICRLAEARHPKYLLLENVQGLLTHEGGQTFLAILTALGQLWYSLEWCVVNSANFGVPQDRKRVYIVGYLDSRLSAKYILSEKAHIQILSSLFPDAKVSVYIPPMEPPYV